MSFKSLPNELGEKIAGLLSAKALASFRRASKSTAELGYRAVRDSISKIISMSDHPCFTGDQFVQHLVSDFQTAFPQRASQVTALCIDTPYRPREKLSDRHCLKVALPRLNMLQLTGVAISAPALRQLIINHRHTLRDLVIEDVALIVAAKASTITRYCAWLSVIAQIQRCKGLESIVMHSLTWQGGPVGHAVSVGDSYISLPNTKYHRRVVDPDDPTACYFKFSNGGLSSEGAVSEGLQTFSQEIRKAMVEDLEWWIEGRWRLGDEAHWLCRIGMHGV